MTGKLVFVLGGGGGRGALQVGALRALHEVGLQPDMLVGTSAGAVNATFLAINGFSADALAGLEENWNSAAEADLLPANQLWLTMRLMFHRIGIHRGHRMRVFFVSHGLSQELRFRDLSIPLIQVATDLNAAEMVLYGTDPDQSVLEGLLASTTLPPWIHPIVMDGRALMDGGVVSNLPIEPALRMGAGEIIALDISDSRHSVQADEGAGLFLRSLLSTVERRQIELELALAAERGVPVRHLELKAKTPVSTWDFSRSDELFRLGYEITRREINKWLELHNSLRPRWRSRFSIERV